jgi:hypothetical protein
MNQLRPLGQLDRQLPLSAPNSVRPPNLVVPPRLEEVHETWRRFRTRNGVCTLCSRTFREVLVAQRHDLFESAFLPTELPELLDLNRLSADPPSINAFGLGNFDLVYGPVQPGRVHAHRGARRKARRRGVPPAVRPALFFKRVRIQRFGGGERTRTADFYVANVALYQLSYTPAREHSKVIARCDKPLTRTFPCRASRRHSSGSRVPGTFSHNVGGPLASQFLAAVHRSAGKPLASNYSCRGSSVVSTTIPTRQGSTGTSCEIRDLDRPLH